MSALPDIDKRSQPTRQELARAAFDVVTRWPAHDYQRLALILVAALFENLPSGLEADWYAWLLAERGHVPDAERPILHLRTQGQ